MALSQSQIQQYPQTDFMDTNSKRPSLTWQLFFQNLLNFRNFSTATKGSAILPSQPVGFISVLVNGQAVKIPYYNV